MILQSVHIPGVYFIYAPNGFQGKIIINSNHQDQKTLLGTFKMKSWGFCELKASSSGALQKHKIKQLNILLLEH